MSWMLFVAVFSTAHALDCGEPVQTEELDGALADAEAAYIDLDAEGFRDKINEISGLLLPCVNDAIPAKLAGRYHRDLALQLSVVGDEEGALSTLQAAKNADPEYIWTDEMLPADHPLRVAYEAMVVEEGGQKVPEPRYGSISFDGVNGRTRPETPSVFQRFDATGRATDTLYIGRGESLPTYRAIPRQRNTLIGCAAGALAASGTTWALGISKRGALYRDAADPSVSADKLDSLRRSANTFTVSSTLLFGGATGCGVAAWLVGER
jgi:hypothetical protein